MKFYRLLTLIACLLLLISCSKNSYQSNIDAFKGYSAQQIYVGGQQALKKKNYDSAVKHFEALSALYPFGEYAERGQLSKIEAYYKNGDLDSTIASATSFIHLYPQSHHIDYAYYMRGLANFEQNKSWINKIYAKDPAARDLTSIRASFVDFSELVRAYPQSSYITDARKRLVYIRNLLARHELQVAQFYMKRKAYVAAANRAAFIVRHFEGAPQVVSALKIMIKAYNAVGATKQAQDAWKVLKLSYPQAAAKI